MLMLHIMAFHLSSKVGASHLDKSMLKLIYNQGCTVFLFPSKLPCCIVNLARKHGIPLIPAYILTHLNVKANCLSQGGLLPEWHFLPHIVQVAFQQWGQLQVDLLASSYTNQCQCYCTLGNLLPLGALG